MCVVCFFAKKVTSYDERWKIIDRSKDDELVTHVTFGDIQISNYRTVDKNF